MTKEGVLAGALASDSSQESDVPLPLSQRQSS